MKTRRAGVGLLSLVLLGCPQGSKAPEKQGRVELRKVTGNTIELLPREGQLPYCLAFSTSAAGPVRQLTMSRENKSVTCEAGKPVMNTSFRIPVEEGKVRIIFFLSSQKLSAASVVDQVMESRSPNWTALDLRLPGSVFAEVLEFTPVEDMPSVQGGIIGADGLVDAGAAPADAGSAGDGGAP